MTTKPIVWIGTPQDNNLCHCVTLHHPAVWVPQAHHCLPEACGGKPTWLDENNVEVPNKVELCSTTHAAVHRAIKLLWNNTLPPHGVIGYYGLAVAHEGVRRIKIELDRGNIKPADVQQFITYSVHE